MLSVEQELKQEIVELKNQKHAVLLAHNYQLPEVQDVADFVGDSLGLSREAAKTDAKKIVFCGVHFMAETASILCPDKKVLLPDMEAGCSLAATISAKQLREWKTQNPDAVVVAYVNTSAEVKAESDYCCTSTNAVKVVESIPPSKTILFLPDMFLGAYVAKRTGRKVLTWPGECHVHARIDANKISVLREQHPDAEFLIHPECGCMTNCLYLQAEGALPGFEPRVLSTEGMLRYASSSPSMKFIVATETGILYRMRKSNPRKEFVPADEQAICEYMKKITLEKVLTSLKQEVYEVKVPDHVAVRARKAIDRMISIG